MSVKINTLQIENVKRVKAVALSPTQNGLTVIGGRNGQGKTSVLDAIAWGLGGERFRPSAAARDGSVLPPSIHIELSNGLIVERKGKNSALTVLDPNGRKSGQQLLNEFVEALALDLPRFMQQSNKDKADTLLRVIGMEEDVHRLERREAELYNERLSVGREADRKKKYAEELPGYPDAPGELVSASDLIRRQQEILARNGENQRKRDRLREITYEKHRVFDEITRLEDQAKELAARIAERKQTYEQVAADEQIALRDAAELQDESTAELERDIAEVERTNVKVRANLDKEKAEQDAAYYADKYASLSNQIDNVRAEKIELLNGAALPLPELSVEAGELTYKGKGWDCMSASEQLRVATAIVRAINPACGFVLLDGLEALDMDTLQDFGDWLAGEGLQVIATRVSTGPECSIQIVDGYAYDSEEMRTTAEKGTKAGREWKAGVF